MTDDNKDDFDERYTPLGSPKIIVGSSSQSLSEILDEREHLVPENATGISKGMPIYNAGEVYYPVQFYEKREAREPFHLDIQFASRDDLADFIHEVGMNAQELFTKYRRAIIAPGCDNSYHQTAYLLEGRVVMIKHNAMVVDPDYSYAWITIY